MSDTTLRWGIGEPSSIIPLNATTPDDLLVVDALFDSLTSWDSSGAVRPEVARRWSHQDATRWRFELRRSAVFSDGTPVTADSFVRTWNQLVVRGEAHHHLRNVVGYGAVRAGRAPDLRGLRAVDQRTLQVRLVAPDADFAAVVGHPALAPMIAPAHLTAATLDQPVGNGPFRMAEPWVHGRFVRLRRARPAPAGQSPAPADEVVFQIHDAASGYIAYEQGGLDVATVPPGALTQRPEDEPRQRYRGPGLLRGDLASTYFILPNLRRPPFDDVRARRAVSSAIDRGRLVDEVFENNATPGASIVPAVVPGGRLRSCLRCTLDRQRARRLFAAAGVKRTTLWISEGGEHEAVAARVRSGLAAAGVRVSVRALPFDRFLAALRKGRPGLYRFGWTLDYPTAGNGLRPLFHSTATPATGGANYSGYADDGVDRLLERAARTDDPRRRIELYRRAEDTILHRDQAIIPLAVLRRRTVVAPRVLHLTYGPLGAVDLEAVRLVESGANGG